MSQKIQIRRGTNSERQSVVFDQGEPVWTVDNKTLYIGDGVTIGGVSMNIHPEDWRYVHTTGSELVSGDKTFNDNVYLSAILTPESLFPKIDLGNQYLYDENGAISIAWYDRTLNRPGVGATLNWNTCLLNDIYAIKTLDWNNKFLTGDWYVYGSLKSAPVYGEGPTLDTENNKLHPRDNATSSIDWENGLLKDAWSSAENVLDWQNSCLYINNGTTISLNWQNRILSGIWTVEQLNGIKFVLSGQAPSTPTSPGVSGQIAWSGDKFFIHTGKWAYITITNWG